MATSTTVDAPITTPEQGVLQELLADLGPLFEDVDRRGLDYFQPGTGAYLYYESLVLLDESVALPRDPVGIGANSLSLEGGDYLDDFELDDDGKIVDLERNGTFLSSSVAGSGTVFDGVDEGVDITGTVHSFRYFAGTLMIVITTTNRESVEGYLGFTEYVNEGQPLRQEIAHPVPPGATMTYVESFSNATIQGGVAHGHLWADGIEVREVELQVPPLNF